MDIQVSRAIERTLELQLIKDKRAWSLSEREEFLSLLTFLHENSMRKIQELRADAQLKKKRRRPLRLPGIH
jgi:hypothetical protein